MSTALLTGGNESSALPTVWGFDILEHIVLYQRSSSYPTSRNGVCLKCVFDNPRPVPEGVGHLR